jgi:ABC-type sugar transport system ATPase subunit
MPSVLSGNFHVGKLSTSRLTRRKDRLNDDDERTALEAQGVGKACGGVVALLGENGAGKSTLVKIVTGSLRPNAGTLRLNGTEVTFKNAANAVSRGVAVVAQELGPFPHLDILDNLFPMREPRIGAVVWRRRMRELALPALRELGVARPLHRPVADLSLAERQLVENTSALIHIWGRTTVTESYQLETLLGIGVSCAVF